MLARDLSALHKGARIVVDVKSTCLYEQDEVLAANGATTDYFKTGHSYIKRRVQELDALAGFEKSGHFFFNQPVGRGYDDGHGHGPSPCSTCSAAIRALHGRSLSRFAAHLGLAHHVGHCADEVKYDVVDRVIARITAMRDKGETSPATQSRASTPSTASA